MQTGIRTPASLRRWGSTQQPDCSREKLIFSTYSRFTPVRTDIQTSFRRDRVLDILTALEGR
ncbi:hypothetical protein CKA32_004690 [Geitlerinema sp. FC II]|nr:hypothetical protein CKA32_004690 [Geitlerinema sp. FC II]